MLRAVPFGKILLEILIDGDTFKGAYWIFFRLNLKQTKTISRNHYFSVIFIDLLRTEKKLRKNNEN